MAKTTSENLTRGNIYLQIINFSLPILIGRIFQNLYNNVDAIVVGQYVGKNALAAVTSSSDISMLLTGFFTGFSVGAGIAFSHYFGANKYKELSDSIHTAITFSFMIGLFMAIGGVLLSPILLNIVACPPEVMAEADSYLRIYFVGVLFTSLYNVGSGVLRAVGDSRSPFYYLVVASLTNIVLDFVFVKYMYMGVNGAGIATVISQGLSLILVFRKLLATDDVYKVVLKRLKLDVAMLKEILTLGIPAAIQSSLISVSNLFVQRYTNEFGASAMAGIGAARKIDRFVGMIGESVGLSASTFVSQNVGSKNYKRAFKGIKACLIIGVISFALTGALLMIFARQCSMLFSTDEEVLKYATDMLYVIVPCFIFQNINQLYSNATRGFGKSTAVMVLSIIGMIVMRQIFLAVALNYDHNVFFIYICYPVGWFFSALFVYIYYVFKIKIPYRKEAYN